MEEEEDDDDVESLKKKIDVYIWNDGTRKCQTFRTIPKVLIQKDREAEELKLEKIKELKRRRRKKKSVRFARLRNRPDMQCRCTLKFHIWYQNTEYAEGCFEDDDKLGLTHNLEWVFQCISTNVRLNSIHDRCASNDIAFRYETKTNERDWQTSYNRPPSLRLKIYAITVRTGKMKWKAAEEEEEKKFNEPILQTVNVNLRIRSKQTASTAESSICPKMLFQNFLPNAINSYKIKYCIYYWCIVDILRVNYIWCITHKNTNILPEFDIYVYVYVCFCLQRICANERCMNEISERKECSRVV